MPARAPRPYPHLESGPSATDPAPVRDPPQSAPAAPLARRRRPAETATATGHSRAAPGTTTDSRRWHDQRISPGRMRWMRFSALTTLTTATVLCPGTMTIISPGADLHEASVKGSRSSPARPSPHLWRPDDPGALGLYPRAPHPRGQDPRTHARAGT